MIGFAFCGSFCTHKNAVEQLGLLIDRGFEVLPVFSERVQHTDTRFGKSRELITEVERLCGRAGVKDITEAEKQITGGGVEVLVVAPCTGNTLAKAALGITDGVITMAIKAHLRNKKPLLIAFASNDGLSGSLKNIAAMLEKKHVYFVPLRQDDPVGKPNSLVCNWASLPAALDAAREGKQLYPLVVE